MNTVTVRKAVQQDSPTILHFMRELAKYERADHEIIATESTIESLVFAESSVVNVIIAEVQTKAVGFAVYYFNYSVWRASKGLYLEALYVQPERRRSGAGKAMLKQLAKIALDKHCQRFEWNVLNWNAPALKFYASLGAHPKNESVGYQLTGPALKKLSEV